MPSPSRNAGKWRMGAGEFGTGKLERVKGEPFPASNPLIDNRFLPFTPRNQARLRTTAVGPATTDRPSPSCGGYPQPSKSEAMGGQVSRDRQVSMATATPSCIHAPSAPSAGALLLFTPPLNPLTTPALLHSRAKRPTRWRAHALPPPDEPLHGPRSFALPTQHIGGQLGRRAGQRADGDARALQGLHLRGDGEADAVAGAHQRQHHAQAC